MGSRAKTDKSFLVVISEEGEFAEWCHHLKPWGKWPIDTLRMRWRGVRGARIVEADRHGRLVAPTWKRTPRRQFDGLNSKTHKGRCTQNL